MKELNTSQTSQTRAEYFRTFWNNFRRTMVETWKIDKWALLGRSFFIIVQVATNLAALFFGTRVLNELTIFLGQDNYQTDSMFIYLGLAVLFGIIEQLAWQMLSYYERTMFWQWNLHASLLFNQKVSELDLQRFDDRDFDNFINKLAQNYQWGPSNYVTGAFNVVHAILKLLTTVFVLVALAPWLLPLLVLALVPTLTAQVKLGSIRWNIWGSKGDESRLYWRSTTYLREQEKLQETKIFGTRSYLIGLIRRVLGDFNGEQVKVLKGFLPIMLFSRIFEGLIVGGIEVWLIFRVLARNGFGIGDYSFYTSVMMQFNNSAGLLVSSLGGLHEYNLFMTDLYALQEIEPILDVPKNPVKIPSNKIPIIEFRNVTFIYPGTEARILDDFSMTIKPGEDIALVGENGAGKTTLIKLLMRFYDVTDGQILIDGNDIRKLDIDSWYRHVGVLFQEFNDYPFSVRDNIAIGRIKYFDDDKRVKKSAEMAEAAGFVNKYEHGYDTVLDKSFKKGIKPSGGQWQRVALARAFFRDAGILVLDEPTSAIDANAEYEIFENISKTQKDKTTIIVSHRFSTVRKANKIYVVEHGRIVENGNHAKLMKNKGLYHKMFTKQAEGYK